MIRQVGAGRAASALFVLALLMSFAVCALVLTLTGAAVYRETARDMELEYETGTALSYVANKLHSHDGAGAVRLETVEGISMLVLEQAEYQTWIYCWEDSLRELTVRREWASPSLLANGQELLPAADFRAEELRPGLWRLTVTTAGGETATRLTAIRSGEVEE